MRTFISRYQRQMSECIHSTAHGKTRCRNTPKKNVFGLNACTFDLQCAANIAKSIPLKNNPVISGIRKEYPVGKQPKEYQFFFAKWTPPCV